MGKRCVVALLGVLTLACGSTPSAVKAPKIAKCEAQGQQVSTLVVDWPAADKSALETAIGERAVVVAFDGCRFKILDGCQVPGRYVFRETSRATDGFVIRKEDEINNRFPVRGGDLIAEMERSEQIELSYVTVGTRSVKIPADHKGKLRGSCDGATHLVRTVVVGAYEMVASGDSANRVIRSGGDLEECKNRARASATSCQAMLQLMLVPVEEMSSDREDIYEKPGERVAESSEPDQGTQDTLTLSGHGSNPSQAPSSPPQPSSSAHSDSSPSGFAARIAAIPDGGSNEWDRTIATMMVSEYDTNSSNSIDTDGEVKSIPCDVLKTLDRSIRKGRGGVSALRTTYGFPASFIWVGDSLGFDEKIRSSADSRLKECGLN